MTKNKGGRPTTEAYRKKIFRYSKVEDLFLPILDRMADGAEKDMFLEAMEQLKGNK